MTITELEDHVSELQEYNADNTNLNPEVKPENKILTKDVLLPSQNIANNYYQNENEMHHHPSQV